MFSAVFVGLLAFFGSAYSNTTQVSQCNSNGGPNPAATLPINTYINGCITPPCQLPTGSNAAINMIFRAPRNIQSMTSLATAFLGPIPVPYPLGAEAITCNFLTNTYCPLVRDEVVQYTLSMPIEAWMGEGTSATIEFFVRDDSDRSIIACVRTSIIIVAPSANSSNDNLNDAA